MSSNDACAPVLNPRRNEVRRLGFPDAFRVRGWMESLAIKDGALFVYKGIRKNPKVFSDKRAAFAYVSFTWATSPTRSRGSTP